jgi:hypothetical protein
LFEPLEMRWGEANHRFAEGDDLGHCSSAPGELDSLNVLLSKLSDFTELPLGDGLRAH